MLKQLFRFPIKGFRGEELSQAFLKPGIGIVGDRNFAFTFADLDLEHLTGQSINLDESRNTLFLKKTSLLNQMQWPNLAEIEVEYDFENKLLQLGGNGMSVSGNLDDFNFRKNAETFVFEFLKAKKIPKLRPLVFVGETNLSRYPDRSSSDISLLNIQSLKDLAHHYGEPLDMRSFRGNLIVDMEPWEEEKYLGKTVDFQGVQIKFETQIGRCQNICVHPENATQNDVLKTLIKYRGKGNFGILGKVLNEGTIRVN